MTPAEIILIIRSGDESADHLERVSKAVEALGHIPIETDIGELDSSVEILSEARAAVVLRPSMPSGTISTIAHSVPTIVMTTAMELTNYYKSLGASSVVYGTSGLGAAIDRAISRN